MGWLDGWIFDLSESTMSSRMSKKTNALDASSAPQRGMSSEGRYRRLFESARDGILLLDAASRKVTEVNPFMADLLGYSREELLGKQLWEIGLFESPKDNDKAFEQLKKEGDVRFDDLPLQTKRGSLRVEFVSHVYNEDNHEVIQCNIRDVTERKEAEEQLIAA